MKKFEAVEVQIEGAPDLVKLINKLDDALLGSKMSVCGTALLWVLAKALGFTIAGEDNVKHAAKIMVEAQEMLYQACQRFADSKRNEEEIKNWLY